jgi:signal transduction histidine kinase
MLALSLLTLPAAIFFFAQADLLCSLASIFNGVLLLITVVCSVGLVRSKDVRWSGAFAHAVAFVMIVLYPLAELRTNGLALLDPTGTPQTYLMLTAPLTLAFTAFSLRQPRATLAYAVVAFAYTLVGALWSPVGADLAGTGPYALLTLTGLVLVTANVLWNSDAVWVATEESVVVAALAKDARAEARTERRANEAKTRFMSVLSHEIRNPLQAILLQVDLLQASRLTETQRNYVSGIHTASTVLHSIVRDVLEVGKMEAGALRLETIPMSLSTVIEETVRSRALVASSSGVELLCHIPPDLSTDILGDPTRIRQVVDNLVSNALKFTSTGEIEVSLTLDEEAAAWRLSVRDTGIGIDEAGLEKLFHEFSQVDASTSRVYGGTGLGLFICKQLANLMGGYVTVESQPGVGSTFTLHLPATPPPVSPPPDVIEPPRHVSSPPAGCVWVPVVYATNAALRRLLHAYVSAYFVGTSSADVLVADRPNVADHRLRTVLRDASSFRRVLVVINYADCTPSMLHLLSSASSTLVATVIVDSIGSADVRRSEGWRHIVDKPVAWSHLALTLQRATRTDRIVWPSPRPDATDTSSSRAEASDLSGRRTPPSLTFSRDRHHAVGHAVSLPVRRVYPTRDNFDTTQAPLDQPPVAPEAEPLPPREPRRRPRGRKKSLKR